MKNLIQTLEEIHAIRDNLAQAANYDLERMLEAARERQAASGMRAVRAPTSASLTAGQVGR